MRELLYLHDNGTFVWVAYGITLGVVIWNVWSARAGLRRNLRSARDAQAPEAPRQAKIRQL